MKSVTSEMLDEMIFKLLKEIHALENRDIDRFKVSWRDIHVLKYLLKKSPCRVSEIALELDMPLFAVSRLIAALTERGFVGKAKDESDKRNTYISLTPDGVKMIKQVQANYYNLFSGNLELMEEEDARTMLTSMGNVGKLLETISTKRKVEMKKPAVQEVYAAKVLY